MDKHLCKAKYFADRKHEPILQCPICQTATFKYVSYAEIGWGIVEQHGFCSRCGYTVEQAYSPVYEGFRDIKKGFRDGHGNYIPKDFKRHRRIRRKMNIKNTEINPLWMRYI